MSACSRELVECETSCENRCGDTIKLLLLNPNADEQFKFEFKPGGDESLERLDFNPSYTNRRWMCSFSLFGTMYLIGKSLGHLLMKAGLQVATMVCQTKEDSSK